MKTLGEVKRDHACQAATYYAQSHNQEGLGKALEAMEDWAGLEALVGDCAPGDALLVRLASMLAASGRWEAAACAFAKVIQAGTPEPSTAAMRATGTA